MTDTDSRPAETEDPEVAKELEGKPGHYSYTDQLSIEEAEALFK